MATKTKEPAPAATDTSLIMKNEIFCIKHTIKQRKSQVRFPRVNKDQRKSKLSEEDKQAINEWLDRFNADALCKISVYTEFSAKRKWRELL
jgi:hypothetical protein